jgi:hypothetical protein
MERASATSSAKERGFVARRRNERNVFNGTGRGSRVHKHSKERNTFRWPGRWPMVEPNEQPCGFTLPGCRVCLSCNNGNDMCAYTLMKDSITKVRCHVCGALVHGSTYCWEREICVEEKMSVQKIQSGPRVAVSLLPLTTRYKGTGEVT